jgi:hypothetical protein
MIGPKKTPKDFGFKAGDHHIVVNDVVETAKCYTHAGKLLWERACLARGIYEDTNWRDKNSDTPPGLYRLGAVYRDFENADRLPLHVRKAFGWVTFDMEELEGQEAAVNRAGICLHGGGSRCGWPGAWQPYQSLYPTFGCVRMYNQDLRDLMLPLMELGTVYMSVWQEG